MISKIPSCLAKICQETALAFKKTNGRKAIAQCAKELGVETESGIYPTNFAIQ